MPRSVSKPGRLRGSAQSYSVNREVCHKPGNSGDFHPGLPHFCTSGYMHRLVPEFCEVPTVLRFFLFLCALNFVSTGLAAEKVAATVNGESITLAELDTALAQLPPPTRSVSELQKRQQRSDALQVLIDDRLVRQFLKEQPGKFSATANSIMAN